MNKKFITFIDSLLPWDDIKGVENTFRASVILFLLLTLVLSFLVMTIQLPEKNRKDAEKIPDRLAKLVLEKKEEPPPPPPPEPEKEPEPEPEKEPEPKKEEPKPEPKPEKKKEVAKKQAEEKIKEVEDALAGLRDLGPLVNQNLTKSGANATKVSRNLLTSRAGKGSGGINLGTTSSGGGGAGDLSGIQVAQVQTVAVETSTRKVDSSGVGRRTTEEIRRAIDRHVGALNSIYRRATRKDPTLQGALVLRLVIEANGVISHAEIVSSDLKNDELLRKLLVRFKRITFEDANVKIWDDKYTLNFYPS